MVFEYLMDNSFYCFEKISISDRSDKFPGRM